MSTRRMAFRVLAWTFGGMGVVALVVGALLSVGNSKDSADGPAMQSPDTSAPPSAAPARKVSRDVKIAVIGDVYITGTSAGGASSSSWPVLLTKRFADEDGLNVKFKVSIHRGAGYITRGPDQLTLGEAISRDARTDDDIVLAFGSGGDIWQRPGLLDQSIANTVKVAKKRSPSARIVLVGTSMRVSSDPIANQNLADAISRADNKRGVIAIDPLSEGWFRGKSARLMGSDGVSPTSAGQRAIASELYDALRLTVGRASKSDSLPPGTTATAETLANRTGLGALLDTKSHGATARAVRGHCAAGVTPYLELSRNTKSGFASVPLPVSELLSLSVTKTGRISVVGLDESCSFTTKLTLESGGFAWIPADPSGEWFVSPSKGKVHTPSGDAKSGCRRVLSLSVVTESIARVGCDDGTLRGTMNGGRKWVRLGALPDLRAISYSSPSVGVALSAFEGCAALSSLTRDGGNSWKHGACIPGKRAEAVSFNGLHWLAQVSGVPYVTLDSGTTWRPFRPK